LRLARSSKGSIATSHHNNDDEEVAKPKASNDVPISVNGEDGAQHSSETLITSYKTERSSNHNVAAFDAQSIVSIPRHSSSHHQYDAFDGTNRPQIAQSVTGSLSKDIISTSDFNFRRFFFLFHGAPHCRSS
jgi:hypothetical protein